MNYFKIFSCFKKQKPIGKFKLGLHSYRSKDALVKVWANDCVIEVGKYCSLAKCTFVYDGNHNLNYASTYPFKEIGLVKDAHPNQMIKLPSKVGNDVWIADDVIIHSGIIIGDGSIIAGQSVVTKDVPPYAVVAGNPARIVKYRFSPDIIQRFINVKWWDLPESIVISKLACINNDPIKFLEVAEDQLKTFSN